MNHRSSLSTNEPNHHTKCGDNIAERATQVTQALRSAWEGLRQIDQRIPAAVLLTLSAGDRRSKLGHIAFSSWQYRESEGAHEVAISPDLYETPEAVLECMLHEAAHAILYPVHSGGCGPDRRYHRREFRDLCRELGLECNWRHGRYGWCDTQWPTTGVAECYMPVLKGLEENLPLGTGSYAAPRHQPRKLPPKGHVRLCCACSKPRSVYVGRAKAAEGGIICARCQCAFRAA